VRAASTWLVSEAEALEARLGRLRPLSLEEQRSPSAEVDPRAMLAIERHLGARVSTLKGQLRHFAPAAHAASPVEGQRLLTLLRQRFNLLLADYDIFSDALAQRSQPTHGPWLAGLDALAEDALQVDGLSPPPLICYLDRGRGAAIRRARTRLPTGRLNPVAVVRLPRERLVGSGVAASLFHEVGHQGSELLGLLPSLRPVLRALGLERPIFALWERWLSEVVADLWAVARGGVCAPLGLISVVSLPKYFVFRVSPGDPHPVPWIRVLVSTAFGHALYPAGHWRQLADAWRDWYPLALAPARARPLLGELLDSAPSLVELLLQHRVPSAGGRTVRALLERPELAPGELRHWGEHLEPLQRLRPSMAIAAVGLARVERRVSGHQEAELVDQLLQHWAVQRHFQRLKRIPTA
jgi:hypothetical protein